MLVLASSVNVIKTFSFAADEHAKIIYLTVFSNIPAYFASVSDKLKTTLAGERES
jgi:hypothetical protein